MPKYNGPQLEGELRAALGARYSGGVFAEDGVELFGSASAEDRMTAKAVFAAHVPDPLFGKPDHLALRTFLARPTPTAANQLEALRAIARVLIGAK